MSQVLNKIIIGGLWLSVTLSSSAKYLNMCIPAQNYNVFMWDPTPRRTLDMGEGISLYVYGETIFLRIQVKGEEIYPDQIKLF